MLLFASACKKLSPKPEYVDVHKYILKGDNFSKDPTDVIYAYLYDYSEIGEIYLAMTKNKKPDLSRLEWVKYEILPDFVVTKYIAKEYPPITVLRIVITGTGK